MGLSWFTNRTRPIALDFGTDSIKMLQLEPKADKLHLVAAAYTEIPEELRALSNERTLFAVDAIKKMIHENGFKGRQLVTCLPANQMIVQHLRVAKMSPEELQKILPFECQGKLPFDPSKALLRHMVAGEVYQDQEARTEVILMAASRENIERQLNLLNKAKLEVVGIHVEPVALVECFSHLFRRRNDESIATMFVDIGASATHVNICHGKSIVFAKYVHIGGDHFTRCVAKALKMTPANARQTRIRLALEQTEAGRPPSGVVVVRPEGANGDRAEAVVSTNAPPAADTELMGQVTAAVRESLESLVSELELCVRYYESIFGGKQIDRAIFVGGESRNSALCQGIARHLGIPGLIGDPMARLVKSEKTQCAVDLRQPQPGWAVAVGLGIGIESTN